MRITIVLAVLALWTSVYLTSCGFALATAESDLWPASRGEQSKIHPAHPLYFLKSVREILEIKAAATENIKVLRYLEFSTRRIREVNTLAHNNHPDLIPPTLEKYWLNFNKLNGLVNVTDQDLMRQITDSLAQHLTILERVYHQLGSKRAKMAIRLTIQRIFEENQLLLDKISQQTSEKNKDIVQKITLNQILTCHLLVKQASESGLNDVEKVVLIKRANQCQKIIS